MPSENHPAPTGARQDRRLTTRQQREALRMLEQLPPDGTLVLHFDGVNLREVISGRKIAPTAHSQRGA